MKVTLPLFSTTTSFDRLSMKPRPRLRSPAYVARPWNASDTPALSYFRPEHGVQLKQDASVCRKVDSDVALVKKLSVA